MICYYKAQCMKESIRYNARGGARYTYVVEVSGNDIFVPIPSYSQWFIPIPIPRFSRELFPFPSHSHCLFPIPIPIPDYCKSVLTGLATLSITSLQRVQNAAASLVLNLDHWTHVTTALRSYIGD